MTSIANEIGKQFDRTGELNFPFDADATVQTQAIEGVTRTYFHFRDGSELVTSLTRGGVNVLSARWTE